MKLETIKNLVEKATNKDISTRTRTRNIVYIRSIFFKLARVYTRESLAAIGKVVGRDHATVMHGVRVFDTQIKVYPDAKEYLNIYNDLELYIKKENGIRDRDANPAAYYRKKYASTLLALREERKENRLLKTQLSYNGN